MADLMENVAPDSGNQLVVITPEMLDAGLAVLHEEFRLSGDWRSLIYDMFLAMVLTSPQQFPQAS